MKIKLEIKPGATDARYLRNVSVVAELCYDLVMYNLVELYLLISLLFYPVFVFDLVVKTTIVFANCKLLFAPHNILHITVRYRGDFK